MEEDRAVADLGPDVASLDLNGDVEPTPKTPKRRFVGRKAADAKAAAASTEGNPTASIEESGAIQGTLTCRRLVAL